MQSYISAGFTDTPSRMAARILENIYLKSFFEESLCVYD